MVNPFFLVMGIFFTLLISLGVVRATLSFHKNWKAWKADGKIRQIMFAGLTLLCALYIDVRFYILAFQESQPVLILPDFVILMVLTAVFFLIRLLDMKKKNSDKLQATAMACTILLVVEIISFILWLSHFQITPEIFMTSFYLLLFALTLPIFFFREKAE